jgi:hypothetical protein
MVDRELQWVERGQQIIADFLGEAIERRIFVKRKLKRLKDVSPVSLELKMSLLTPT